MLAYVLRSLAWFLPALVLAHLMGFAYGHIVAPLHAARSPLYATAFSREPLPQAYWAYLAQLPANGLGLLPGNAESISLVQALGQATLNSLGLLGIALSLSVLVGVGFGLLAVRDRPPRIAPWLTATTTVGFATPSFFFGVLGISLVVLFLVYGPGQRLIVPIQGYGWDRHLVLPTIALMLRPTAQIAQITAGLMVAELHQQYVITARSFGVPEARIAWHHVLRNALPGIVAVIAAALRLTAGELIIVETLFGWPGLGQLIGLALIPSNSSLTAEGALFLNPPVLGATLVVFTGLFLLSAFGAGVLIRALDPRLR